MPFKSKSQHRAFRAMEARGELPKGTSTRWAHETKSIKGLPEKKMKKEAMFFENRELAEDGMFMKCAELPEVDKVKPKKAKPLPIVSPKAETQAVRPGEARKSAKLPVKDKAPTPLMGHGKCAFDLGHIGIGRSHIKMAQGMGMTPPVGAGMDVSAGGAGSPGAVQMGTGRKIKKRKIEKKAADDLLESAGRTVKSVASGAGRFATKDVPAYTEAGLKKIEGLPDWAKAALVGGTGYVGYRKAKKLLKKLTARPIPATEGIVGKALRGFRRLRGR